MASKSKAKGNRFEYLCRDIIQEGGVYCKRAYASNGLALGLTEDVDLLATHQGEQYPLQCKARKRIAEWIKPNGNVFAQLIKEDRGEALAVVRLEDLIKLIKANGQ